MKFKIPHIFHKWENCYDTWNHHSSFGSGCSNRHYRKCSVCDKEKEGILNFARLPGLFDVLFWSMIILLVLSLLKG